MSRLLVLSLPSGWELLPAEARARLSYNPASPEKPVYQRAVRTPPGAPTHGAELTQPGRTPQEALANVVAVAWRQWFQNQLDTAGTAQLVEAPPLLDANVVAHTLLPMGYTFLSHEPLRGSTRRSSVTGNDVTGYRRGVLVPGGTLGAGPTHTVCGDGTTPAEACSRAIVAAWDHYHDNEKGTDEAPAGAMTTNEARGREAIPVVNLTGQSIPAYTPLSAGPATGKTAAMVSAIVEAIRDGRSVVVASGSFEAGERVVSQVAAELLKERAEPEPAEDGESAKPDPEIDLTRQGLELPPGYTFERPMDSQPARVYADEDGRTIMANYNVVVTTDSGKIRLSGYSRYPGQARVIAAARAWGHYEKTRRQLPCPHSSPKLPDGYTWGTFTPSNYGDGPREHGWSLTVKRPQRPGWPSDNIVARAPTRAEAVKLGAAAAWAEVVANGNPEPRLVPPESLGELLNRTVRRHLTTYTVPDTETGEKRAAAFVRILPPGYRHRDAAPVASAPGVQPTIYTDVVAHWTEGTAVGEGRRFQSTDVDAGIAATRAALLAWEHYEQRKEQREVTTKFDQPLPPEYVWNGLPVPPCSSRGAPWVQSVAHPRGYLSGRGGTAEAARREGYEEAWAHWKRANPLTPLGSTIAEPEKTPHGFKPGDRVRFRGCDAQMKYNRDALETLDPGTEGTVQEPPNEGFPADAVQVAFDRPRSGGCGGVGAVDARLLQIVRTANAVEYDKARVDITIAPDARLVLPPGYSYSGRPGRLEVRGGWAQLITTPSLGTLRGIGDTPDAAVREAAAVAARHEEDERNTRAQRERDPGPVQVLDGICPLTGACVCPAPECPMQCPHAGRPAEEPDGTKLDRNAGDDQGGGTITSATFRGVWARR